jgi:hypothetical protein
MELEFIKYSSIEQFRSAIKCVRDYSKHHELPLPTLKFNGTVKLHGTNACVVYDVDTDSFAYQSRERMLSLTQDNAGFMLWASQEVIKNVFRQLVDNSLHAQKSVYFYGEWAGGNIQKGVGISGLDKKFYIFRIVVDGKAIDMSKFFMDNESFDFPIYSVYDFPTFEIEIDFNNPEQYQNQLVEWTINVENECPVAKHFGIDNGTGEGIVWENLDTGVMFKTKGEKHSVSKVKTLKEIAPVDIAKMESMKEFIDTTVTVNRLNQGLDKLVELGLDADDSKNIGAYIKWVAGDVFKEENDTIIENQFSTKQLGNHIANVARNYFINRTL